MGLQIKEAQSCDPADGTIVPTEPRPRIIHLLAWVSCTAFYLGLQQSEMDRATAVDVYSSTVYSIYRIAWGVGMGIALASLLLLVARRIRGISFPTHPGEFLAVLQGVLNLSSLATYSLLLLEDHGYVDRMALDATWKLSLIIRLPVYAALAFFLVRALLVTHSYRWRVYFILAGAYLVFLCTPWGNAQILDCMELTLFAALLMAVIFDLRFNDIRPWTHWVGISMQVWMWLTQWVTIWALRL